MGACRILVVEDDPVLLLHLETTVMQIVDAEIVLSQTTAEAQAALDAGLDYAFLDIDVLDGTTYAFASALVERRIPFAFLSASSREQVPDALRAAPFVAKPYSRSDIVRLLHDAGKC